MALQLVYYRIDENIEQSSITSIWGGKWEVMQIKTQAAK